MGSWWSYWSSKEPEPEESNTPAIIGGVFGALGALIVIIALIVICLRKKGEIKSKFQGFGRKISNSDAVLTEIDTNPSYTGMDGPRQSQYQYDLYNQSRTNAVDRNTYYSAYNYGSSVYSVTPIKDTGDQYVEISLK